MSRADATRGAAARKLLLAPAALAHVAAAQGAKEGREQAAAARRWLDLLQAEDPQSAIALAGRLEPLLATLGADGLGRWILAGLRRDGADLAQQRAWFRLEDPQAVAAWHSEAGAQPLQNALAWLGLLVNGLLGVQPLAAPADPSLQVPVQVQVRPQTQLNAPRMRPVLTPGHLLLPDDYTVFDGAGDRLRLYRAAVAHAAAHLRYSVPARPVLTLKPLTVAVVSAIEDARVEQLLLREFPGVRNWFVDALAGPPDPSDLSFSALLSRMDRVLLDADAQDDNYWVNKARRLFDQTLASAGLDDYDAFRAAASILANDLGQMRVRFDPQQYVVPSPYRDDNSYLWNYGEPKSPPDDDVVLQQVGARAPLDANPARNDGADAVTAGAEMELGRFSYPEWDRRIERLRPDWCTVIEKRPAWQGLGADRDRSGSGAGVPVPVALPRTHHFGRTRRLRRQWEGDDLDLNAAIEVMIERRSELQPEPRLFMGVGREPALSSILVLLDLSESANDRASGAALSLLEIEKQAALWLAESLTLGGDRLAVHGFSSNTRAEVYYYRMLEFGVLPTATSRSMIDSVQARYSTRMGAALRHATYLLQREPEAKRSIVLVSDGAPCDIDVHEPNYLTEDARAAVLEARKAGVTVHCIAVDAGDASYVGRIFGWRNFTVVPDARSLPAQLQRACARLATH